MVFNVYINIDDKEQCNTDCFYYNAEHHHLTYHAPYQDGWIPVPNVECEIKIDRPMIHIKATTIKAVVK